MAGCDVMRWRLLPTSCALMLACGHRLDAPPDSAIAAETSNDGASSAAGLSSEVLILQHTFLGNQGAADTVRTLTDEVGPRLAGSQGDARAVAWAVRAMSDRGLQRVRAETVTVPVWVRGIETALIVAPVSQRLAVTALGWSGATPPGGIEADVLRFDSLDALRNAAEGAVAGRIVFLDVPTARRRDGHGYGAAVPARVNGPTEAARKKAAAIVIRSIGTDHSRFPHAGATQRDPDPRARESIPSAALSNADADLLGRILASYGHARLALKLEPKRLPDSRSANVIGDIPGGDRPEEIVLLAAHLDSWDLGTGAVDDAAGCSIVLEAARAIAALPLKPVRTVRVVLFAAEENSLAGAQSYATAHASEAAKHVLAMEADTGTDRVFAIRYPGAGEARQRVGALTAALAPLGIAATDEPAFGGADIRPLRALGVPLVDLAQDMTSYFDVHHTANDTYAQIEPEGLAQASSAFATVAWIAATMDGDLGRVATPDREQ